MRTDQTYMLNRSGFPGGCAQNSHYNPVEFDGIKKRPTLNSYNPNFNSGEFATIKSQAGWNSHKLSFKEAEV